MSGRDVVVRGGSHGRAAQVAVCTAELERLAAMCEAAQRDVERSADALTSVLTDLQPELARCAVYAPFASAGIEWGMLTGSFHAWLRAVKFDVLAQTVRLAARAYDDADAAVQSVVAGLEDSVDAAAAAAVVGVAVVGGVVYYAGTSRRRPITHVPSTNGGGTGAPPGADSDLLSVLQNKGLGAVNRLDPRVVQHVVNGLGVLGVGADALMTRRPAPFKGVNATTALGASLFARLYDGGDAKVTSVRSLGRKVAPSSVTQLVSALDDAPPPAPGIRPTPAAAPPAGRVDVITRQVRGADGVLRRSHVVVLPGTSLWNKPWDSKAPDVRDAQANLQLRAGVPTAEMKVMKQALTAAGVRPHDDLVLTGHSQGGMTAVALSRDAEFAKDFHVRSVVTAGGPVGGLPVPDGVTAVHLQDGKDLVPAVDGEPPRDSTNEVTMTFDGGRPDVMARHSIPNYVDGARAFDDLTASGATDDGTRSAVDARRRLVESGALAGPGEMATVRRVVLERDTH